MNWRNWIENPPQIPHMPVIAERDGKAFVIKPSEIDPAFNVYRLWWMPTGQYREEFYSVTGIWE
jgi:hypothetical protein